MERTVRRLTFGALCCLPLCLAGMLVADEPAPKASESKSQADDDYALMKTFVDTFEQVERNYVKNISRRELMQAAIEGMVSKLDQYSSYISPEEMTKFSESVDQEFGGIGIQIHLDERAKRLAVMTPLPGTPAYRAGIRAGDIIMEIDGKTTEGKQVEQAVRLLKGKPGSTVKLGVMHQGSNKMEDISVVRDIIHVSTVLGDHYKEDGAWDYMLDPESKIGYLRLTHFSRHSAIELEKALNELKEAGMKALILDLRFNPGGLFSQATEIADMFVEGGKIVSTKGRNAPERTWEAKKAGTFTGFPMAVLVNHFSASASEIVSACLQDHKRATIVGERTWGKGSVQNVIELEGGSSALKLTTSSYHRPSGKNIHKFQNAKDSDEWGVTPDKDMLVRFSEGDIRGYLEARRDRDVLAAGGPPKSTFKDTQLDKALEAVKSQLAQTGDGKKPDGKPEEKEKEKPAVPEKKAAGLEIKAPMLPGAAIRSRVG